MVKAALRQALEKYEIRIATDYFMSVVKVFHQCYDNYSTENREQMRELFSL